MKNKAFFILLLFASTIISSCIVEDDDNDISQSGSITIIAPASGDNWQIGTEQTIKWSDDLSEEVSIDLYKGSSYIQSISSYAYGSEYTWTVPNDLTPDTDYKIKITSTSSSSIYSESDYFEISEKEKSRFVAKWIVDNKKINNNQNNTAIKPVSIAPENNYNGYSIKTYPNLIFFQNSDWSNKIVIKNRDNESYDNVYDDDEIAEGERVYFYFSFQNNSEVSIPDPFYIEVYLDGELVSDLLFDYWTIEPYNSVRWVTSVNNISAGEHTVYIKLDSRNEITESNEADNEFSRTFTVLGAGAAYESFEFLENRYFITKTDGSFFTGDLSASGDVLSLYNFGTITINSIDDYNISFELEINKNGNKSVINAHKSSEIQETEMTKILTPITWKLVASDCPGLAQNGKWTFTSSGTYWFQLADGTLYRKSWEYLNETSILYGPYGGPCTGVSYITYISTDELRFDDNTYYYEFVPY